MAEVTPSNPKGSRGAAAGGEILGGVIGLLVAVLLSIVALSMASFSGSYWDGSAPHTAAACGRGIVQGIVLLALGAALGWLAWYMHVRNRSRTFGAGFLRGLATVVAAFLLIPWPCSYTWGAFMSFGICGH